MVLVTPQLKESNFRTGTLPSLCWTVFSLIRILLSSLKLERLKLITLNFTNRHCGICKQEKLFNSKVSGIYLINYGIILSANSKCVFCQSKFYKNKQQSILARSRAVGSCRTHQKCGPRKIFLLLRHINMVNIYFYIHRVDNGM